VPFEFMQLAVWDQLVKKYNLNPTQIDQFARYLALVQEHSELFNLTAIKDAAGIIAYHFQDSLAISNYVDFNKLSMIADVGSGAGFPGVPLKILFPHLNLILIEVSKKKIAFLNMVFEKLKLENCQVWDMDWRTFLRKTDEPIELFVSRASLHTDELMRMFKPSCPYNNRQLVYWASVEWQITKQEEPFFEREIEYMVKTKKRRLIFFARH